MSRKSSKALIALGLVAVATAAAPTAHADVFPREVECASYDSDANAVRERLLAVNTSESFEPHPITGSNFFYPGLDDRGQPAQFVPGRQSWDVDLAVSPDELLWSISGHNLKFHPTADNA